MLRVESFEDGNQVLVDVNQQLPDPELAGREGRSLHSNASSPTEEKRGDEDANVTLRDLHLYRTHQKRSRNGWNRTPAEMSHFMLSLP